MSSPLPPLPTVSDLATAGEVAQRFEGVISLAGSRAGTGQLRKHPHRLWLPIEDTDEPDTLNAPSADTVRRILAFAGSTPDPLLVHCRYGQSRSVAAALGIAVHRGWDALVASRELLAAHPANRPFTPNELLLGLFDSELGCAGRLLRAGIDHVRT